MEEQRGWRSLPPILIVALALDACASLAGVAWSRFGHELTSEIKWGLAIRGIYFAIAVLTIGGYLELARRRTGWAARGLRIAAALVAIDTLLWIFVAWYYTLHPPIDGPGWFESVWKYAALALRVLPAIALAIAAWDRKVLAIAGVALVVGVDAAHYWLASLVKWLDAGDKGYMTLISAIALVDTAALVLLAIGAARGEAAAEPRRAATGLQRAASSLTLRLVASLAGSGLGLLVGLMGHGGDHAEGLVKLGVFGGLLVNVIADVVFATGAIEASRAAMPDLARWPLALAAAAVAWCAGALLEKAPDLYQVLYGHHDAFYGSAKDTFALFSAAVPLVETLGMGAVAAVIGAFAGRRSLSELSTHASGKGVGFVALMLASVGIAQWIVPEAKSEGGLMMMLLCILAAVIYALVLMMRLCKLGAEAVEAEPSLPAAKLV